MTENHNTISPQTGPALSELRAGQQIIRAHGLATRIARSEKSRTQKPDEYPQRFPVGEDQASWEVEYPGYAPAYFVSQVVLDNDETKNPDGWADPEDISLVDHEITSYEGDLVFDEHGYPLNPFTRTGIRGRGMLGRHGPNFAADPIISRINPQTGQFEVAAVVRGQTGEDAIPGGMVDKGEAVSATLGREFKEETGEYIDMSGARLVYRGYVDDPRNTDNAWIETTAMHLHLTPEQAALVTFPGPEDPSEITAIKWLPINKHTLANLYASHGELITKAIEMMLADKEDISVGEDVRQSLQLALAA